MEPQKVSLAESASLADYPSGTEAGFETVRLVRETAPMLPNVPAERHRVPCDLVGTLLELVRAKARWPLYLWGPTGTGKTCAAIWLLRHVPGPRAYVKPGYLMDWITRQEDWSWEHVKEARLVVVDELGNRSSPPDFECEAIQRLADIRDRKPTIWISNHRPKVIAELYDDRIASRICCGTVFELAGADRRFA